MQFKGLNACKKSDRGTCGEMASKSDRPPKGRRSNCGNELGCGSWAM
ncbi:hypothetical protein [Phormidium sp. CCY1219]|nr:hypothetical protein [Phormidium sp. CCY1219]MEB3827066.1 hypothetical protein [Phormidium sp. CCY1219]